MSFRPQSITKHPTGLAIGFKKHTQMLTTKITIECEVVDDLIIF